MGRQQQQPKPQAETKPAPSAPPADPQSSAPPVPAPEPVVPIEAINATPSVVKIPFSSDSERFDFEEFQRDVAVGVEKMRQDGLEPTGGVFKLKSGEFVSVEADGSVVFPADVQDHRTPAADKGQPPAAPVVAAEPEAHWEDLLDEMEEAGYVLSKSADGKGGFDVTTKGGRSLHFPGDEARARALTFEELAGVPREKPSADAGRGGKIQPVTLEDLRERDGRDGQPVILHERVERERLPEDKAEATGRPTGRTIVVTRGGRKLTFPGDEVKAGMLTEAELDGVVEDEKRRTVFTTKG